MGMCTSFTKNPMKPIIRKPIPVALAIAVNSFLSGFVHFLQRCIESLANCLRGVIIDSVISPASGIVWWGWVGVGVGSTERGEVGCVRWIMGDWVGWQDFVKQYCN